ncbi:MAG: ABC transporter permease [Chloroflexi bacterium]|nr:ABC transporter permease [Chloroflexota bacterium]
MPLIVSLTLLFLSLSQNYTLDPTPPPGWHPSYFNAYNAWLAAIDVFVLFAPLAATLPYADSYLRDREQGFARYALLRMTHRRYLVSKFVINGLIGGLAVALPMILFFGYTYSIYARTLPPLAWSGYTEEWMRAIGFLGGLFVPHPNLYIFARIMLGFLFGLTYATLGMAISPFVRSRYIVLAFPLVFCWVFAFLANFLGVPALSPDYVLVPDGILSSTATTILVPLGTTFFLSTISIFGFIRKYDRLQLY